MRPGPSQNPNTFSGKREPMFVKRFSKLLLRFYTPSFSKDFPWFLPSFLPIWPMFRDYFGAGVKMGPTFTDFLYEIHPFGRHIAVYLTFVKFLPLGTCRGTQIFLILSIYGMHRYENFRNLTLKKVLERSTFLKRHTWSSSPFRHKL